MIIKESQAKNILSKSRVYDYALVDRYNYHYADWVYKKYGMGWARNEAFLHRKGEELRSAFENAGIP